MRARRFSYESPEKLKEREKGFVLDGVVLSRLGNEDTKRSNPSLNIGIPQYNALRDPANQTYLRRRGLPKAVKEIAEVSRASDYVRLGLLYDRFIIVHVRTHTHTSSLSTHVHPYKLGIVGSTESRGIGVHDGKGVRSLRKE